MRRNILSVLTLPVLLLLIPIIDTTLVTVSRKLAGRSVSQGGRDHTSHRLVALGLSERAAALTLWTFAAISGATAVAVRNLPWQVGALVVPAFGLPPRLLRHLPRPRPRLRAGRLRGRGPGAARSCRRSPTSPTSAASSRCSTTSSSSCSLTTRRSCCASTGTSPSPSITASSSRLPLVLAVQLVSFLSFGLYRGLWRYTSLQRSADLVPRGDGRLARHHGRDRLRVALRRLLARRAPHGRAPPRRRDRRLAHLLPPHPRVDAALLRAALRPRASSSTAPATAASCSCASCRTTRSSASSPSASSTTIRRSAAA